MRLKLSSIILSLLVLATSLIARKKSFPEQILNARSVAIMYLSASGPAGDVTTPGLLRQDRAALGAVEAAFRKWNRYSVTIDPRQADLIIAVRTAQQIVRGGINLGRQDGSRTTQGGGGADLGPNVDMIQVFAGNLDLPNRGVAGPVLWTGAERNGLELPDLPLLQHFHQEVDEAAKNRK